MGMHFGFIVANASWPSLLAALQQMGEITQERQVSSMEDVLEDDSDEDYSMVGGELDGKAYLVESSFFLSCDPDLILALSKRSEGVVIGCTAETVSGSFDFILADRGEIRRWHHHCYQELDAPFDMGEPLDCEREGPLEGIDGEGLFAGIQAMGFDYDQWDQRGVKYQVIWKHMDWMNPAKLSTRPLQAQLAEHRRLHKLKEEPKIELVDRKLGSGPKRGCLGFLFLW